MATLGTRAIARVQGSGSGFAEAKKLADLYVATNTNDAGKVKDPAVYQRVIDDILAPFAGTLDGQNLIADYRNKMKMLSSEKNESESSISALRQKEYSAWYIDEDDENASFRNPTWVAQMTSESLDMILAETLELRDSQSQSGKDTSELDSYITELSRRADRMRTISQQLEDGVEADLDGYGYFVDTDPNTGVVRGASFMPTDAPFRDLAENTTRTDSMVRVGNKRVPVYLPYVKAEDGTAISNFGGIRYEGDSKLLSGDGEEAVLSDRTRYSHGLSNIQMGKVYQTFTGKTNIDGSFKKDYVYVSPENKLYRFSDDDARGKQLIDSIRSVNGEGVIEKISPNDVSRLYTEPLPEDTTDLVRTASFTSKMQKFALEQEAYDAEVERRKNQGTFSQVVENAPGFVSRVTSGISSFFGAKNKMNQPDQPAESVGGQPSAPDIVSKGNEFFRARV